MGAILTPQPDGYVQNEAEAEFEALVESRRPEGKLSRGKSVFLVHDPDNIDNAGGSTDAIYQVKPEGEPERSDLSFYSEAFCEYETEPRNLEKVCEAIDAYWSGESNPDEDSSCPEYRVSSAKVVKLTELNVDASELVRVQMDAPVPGRNAF